MNFESSSSAPNRKASLRDRVSFAFSTDDLHGLALDFGLDYDELPGDSKVRRVVELIEIVVRREQVLEFIERCHMLKPRGNFLPLLEAARQEPQLFSLEYEATASGTAESKLLDIAMELLKAQSLKAEKTQSDEQISQYTKTNSNSFSSEQTKANLDTISHKNTAWEKSTKISRHISQLNKNATKNEQEASQSPQRGRLHGEIDRLEEHIAGEIDHLLEGIRNKIEELKLKLNDQQPIMQSETLRVARKSIEFQGKQKANFQVSKSPFGQQQSEDQSNRGFGDRQFP